MARGGSYDDEPCVSSPSTVAPALGPVAYITADAPVHGQEFALTAFRGPVADALSVEIDPGYDLPRDQRADVNEVVINFAVKVEPGMNVRDYVARTNNATAHDYASTNNPERDLGDEDPYAIFYTASSSAHVHALSGPYLCRTITIKYMSTNRMLSRLTARGATTNF
jgi:hypothetical protein